MAKFSTLDHRKNSFFISLDVRAKILFAFTFAILVTWCNSLSSLVIAFGFGILITLETGVTLSKLIERLFNLNMFLWVLILFSSINSGGHKLLIFSQYFYLGTAGIYDGIKLALKANSILMIFISFIVTTDSVTLAHALSHLKIPDKLIHLFLFTIRFIHILHTDYIKLKEAIKLRGFRPGLNLHTYKTFGNFVGVLILKSFMHSDITFEAMKCRGFNGKFYLFRHFKFSSKDFLVLFVLLFALLSIGFIEFQRKIG